MYRTTAEEIGQRQLPKVSQSLSAERRLIFDVDQLDADTENGMSKFIATCFLIKEITIGSSLVKLHHVDKLFKSLKKG